MKRLNDKLLKRKGLLKPKKKDNGVKKNIKLHKALRFQVAGSGQFKFIKTTPLTAELKHILGRAVFKILPDEMKQPGMVPVLSVFLDKENRQIVLRADLAEHEDFVVQNEDGSCKFAPDTEFKK